MKSYFVMTVDVDPPFSSKMDRVIEEGLILLLDLLDRYSIKSTFFVPATVALKFRAVMGEIVNLKHEIACHGLKHDPVEGTLNFIKQMQNLKVATEIIESITGVRPVGFRAPLFKISNDCWIALCKNRYFYDSSVVCSPLYGNYKQTFLNSKPYYLSNLSSRDKYFKLLEIPVSVNPLFLLPLGGAWLRILGLRWAKIGIKANLTFHIPIVFYVHPKDVVNVYDLPWHFQRNTLKCEEMLNELIKYAKHYNVRFTTAYELAKIAEKDYSKTV